MSLQARYTILRKIADGGTAEIFLATQHGAHGFEKTVVLKRIFPAFYADPQFRNMLVDEAHIAMTLNHSNIVQVLDLGEADGQYVLAMDLVDGWTLDAVLRRARALNTGLPPALALYLTAEVCRALAYAHAKSGADDKPLGIVHRDISPHNVLLSEQGEVKLTDFGIAKARNRRESSLGNIIKGKIAYMSPEQASGAPIDSRSDLFSVGTMLYVMACLSYPFDAPTDLEMLLLVKSGEGVPPETARPGLNPEIYRVLHRAMAKAPADRYQRAEDMLVDVETVMRVAFRAVGQTELKRWLQDLSMRDGVPPLTRAPGAPWTPPPGQSAHETLELKGVGTTLPPPGPVAAAHPAHPAPAPRPQRVPLPPVRTGLAGKLRPPPPAAAMAVGKAGGKVAGLDPAAATPLPSKMPASTPPGVPHPAELSFERSEKNAIPSDTLDDDEVTAVPEARDADPRATPGSGPVGKDSGRASNRRAARPRPADPGTPETGAHRPDSHKTSEKTPAGVFEQPPATPRRSSTWVAEAVAASAQRAGIAPPPPVGPVVPPPVPIPVAPTVDATAAPLVEAPTPPRSRRTGIAIGIGVAAILVVGISVKTCGGGDAPEEPRGASTAPAASSAPGQATAPPTSSPGKNAPAASNSAATAGSAAGSGDAAGGAATAKTSAEPPPAADLPATGADAPVAGAVAAATGGAPSPSAPSPAVPPAAIAQAEPPPPPVTDRAGEPEKPPAGQAIPGTAADPAPPPSPASTSTTTAGSAPDGDGDGEAPPTTTDRVSVLLKSVPPGADVGTLRSKFGETPVSARFKPGHSYSLVFSKDGYRSVTKVVRVSEAPDQEFEVILRRAPAAKPSPQAPATPAPPPAAVPKPNERTWFQRMFAR